MVPLYAARVQDLGTGDFVVIQCGACGHTAELPPSALIRGLGLEPTAKILDLERRLRCRLCLARGQAVVSIKRKVSSWAQPPAVRKPQNLSDERGTARWRASLPNMVNS